MNVVVVVIVMFAVVIFIVMAMHVYLKLSSGIAYAMLVLFAAWLAYNSDTVSVYQLSAYVVHLLVVTVDRITPLRGTAAVSAAVLWSTSTVPIEYALCTPSVLNTWFYRLYVPSLEAITYSPPHMPPPSNMNPIWVDKPPY